MFFKSRLPAHWIYRPKQSDYGIDGEVEIVSSQGELAGQVFFVQLKGTDCDGVEDALTVRLKLSTVNYFRALPVPVLIVSFHARTARLFAVWFDRLERSLPKEGQQTVSVCMSESAELSDSRIDEMPREFDGIRQLKSKLDLPIGLVLKSETALISGMTLTEIASDLRSILSEGVVKLQKHGLITTHIGTQIVEVLVGVVGRRTIPTGELTGGDSSQFFAANLLTAVGLTLSSVGQKDHGARLISSAGRRGSLLNSFQYGFEAAFCLAADHRKSEALQLANDMISREGYVKAAQFMTLVPLLAGPSSSCQVLTTDLLDRIAREAERAGDPAFAASTQYNLGNSLQSAGNHRAAFHAYRKALRADRRYAKRSYFWRELGCSLFECGHFSIAGRCYERAMTLGDLNCLPLLADAHLWSGEYDRALDGFRAYLETSENPGSEWVLKAAFVRMVRDVVGAGKQKRDRQNALGLATPVEGVFPESQFQAAISADGLCGLAWFNQACSEVGRGNFSNAAKCFCAVALCQRGDLAAWCSAIGSAINSGRPDMAAHLMSAGYRACGEGFTRALFEFIRSQDEGFPKVLVIEKLGDMLASSPRE
jgi:tetratricopeptide (TPR) repeat protein